MFPIKLRIPRIIYINSKVQSEDKDFKKVNKILPRNRKVYHLYEWETSEEVFQDRFHNITYNYLLNSNIEGVYETRMPLKFRAVNELGCVIRPRKNKINRNEQAQGRIYSINELEIKSNQEVKYLPSESYERIFVLHSSTGLRHMFGVFMDCKIYVFIVNSVGPKKQENNELIGLKNIMRKTLDELRMVSEFEEWDIEK